MTEIRWLSGGGEYKRQIIVRKIAIYGNTFFRSVSPSRGLATVASVGKCKIIREMPYDIIILSIFIQT